MVRKSWRRLPAVAAVVLAGARIQWSTYTSHTFPYTYTISLPSSFRPIVIRDPSGEPVDYYFPSLGSRLTDLSVRAVPGQGAQNPAVILRGLGGRDVHKSTSVDLGGRRLSVICAKFTTMIGRYTVETIMFSADNWTWTVTASYEDRYKSMRSTLLRMMKSFRIRA
jgi:hypothetical protein